MSITGAAVVIVLEGALTTAARVPPTEERGIFGILAVPVTFRITAFIKDLPPPQLLSKSTALFF